MIGMVVYHLMKVAKSLEKISENIGQASDDLRENLEQALSYFSALPFFSMFSKKKKEPTTRSKKKRVIKN